MKNLLTALFAACCFLAPIRAAIPPVKKITERYERFQEQTVVLPTPFAKPFIIDQSDIALLAGKTIHHVDLVYTAYRSSPGFDQEALNDTRIAELKKLLPQIDADKPSWALVEQTGAKDRETANTYFHGFVIHYTDRQDARELRTFFSDKAKPMTDYTVSPEKGGTFDYPSGTRITIPANAVTYTDGSPVKGNYELHYREFRNPAEIALSGIPMTYEQKGAEYNFSSVGMYELRGTQNGRELQLQQPVTVDFNCTKVVDDAAFYSLDDKTGKWKKIAPIGFEPQAKNNAVDLKAAFANAEPAAAIQMVPAMPLKGSIWTNTPGKKAATVDSPQGHYMEYEEIGDHTIVRMNANAWNKFRNLSKDSTDLLKAIMASDNAQRTLKIQTDELSRVSMLLFHTPVVNLSANPNATLLAEGMDANHTYPTIVRGLNSPEFGVYNADQIYRIGSPISLSPVYTDAQTGQKIKDLYVACVLDLNYNGSFSFQPNNIICNAKGRNVILLFTNDRKVYVLDEKAFAGLDKSRLKVDFPMTDVSDRIKTPEDLKQLLKL